ncbi:hypothetical protein [Amycolatopsis sp. NPDC051071]|uniref:hypothetical protein n=1 Tax=Amycolatopsis sp. NPDC051071 TaxID=3154637 RepID=UPI0034423194
MKSLAHAARISTALGVLALGSAGLTGTAAAASTPFEVCSPLGCAVQSVRGTVEKSGGQTRVVATIADSSPTASLTARFILTGKTTEAWQVIVDDATRQVLLNSAAAPTRLTVSACATGGGIGGCSTKTVPL